MLDLFEFLLPAGLIAGGLYSLFYLRPRFRNWVQEIKFTQTSSMEDLQALFEQMNQEGLAASFRYFVELKGYAQAKTSVWTPFSKREVSYCASKLYAVTRDFETYRDQDGHVQTKEIQKERVLSDESSADQLFLASEQSSLEVILDLHDACHLDIPETFDRFEPATRMMDTDIFSRTPATPNADVLGYRMQEKTIELHQPLYVLGEAYQRGSAIHIGHPKDPKKPFLISTQSEDRLSHQYDRYGLLASIGGVAAVLIGLLLLWR